MISYDPAYGYEIGHIVRDGLRRMYGESPEDVFYYLTVYNEPIVQPAEPEDVDVEGILRGHVPARPVRGGRGRRAAAGADPRLRGGRAVGAGGPATAARRLGRGGRRLERHQLDGAAPGRAGLRPAGLPHPGRDGAGPVRDPAAGQAPGPVVAVSDYMRAVPDQIRQWVPQEFVSLGTDGFGFSDTRPAARRFFAVDGPSIATQVLQQLARRGEVASPQAAARGDRAVPAARRHGGHHRHHRRRLRGRANRGVRSGSGGPGGCIARRRRKAPWSWAPTDDNAARRRPDRRDAAACHGHTLVSRGRPTLVEVEAATH